MASDALRAIPTPFQPSHLPRRVREAAEALWAWHDAAGTDPDPAGVLAAIGREQDPPRLADAWAAARDACRGHGLDPELLVSRVRAAARIRRGEGVSIVDQPDLEAFTSDWHGDHARLLAGLVGLSGSWQLRMADELARGFFLTSTVIRAARDTERGLQFFPETDRHRLGLDRPDPFSHPDATRRLLWKQAVRARDALARARPLLLEMPTLLAFRSRIYWFGALELLVQAEQAHWNVWENPPEPTAVLRTRVRLMALAGRTAFRGR